MSKINRMRTSEEEIAMIMQRKRMSSTCMDYTSAHVLEYISYWLQMSAVLILKDILGLSIFVSGGNKERKMVHLLLWMLPFYHSLKILSHTIQI